MKKASHRKNFFYYFIPIALVAVLVISGSLFLREWLTYRRAQEEYDQLRDLVAIQDTATVSTSSTETHSAANGEEREEAAKEEGTAADQEDLDSPAETANDDKQDAAYFPSLQIDYTSLAAINSDFVGIIYIPALDLVYPVAHSHDNADYLRKTFEGGSNPSGCIFMDCNASADLQDGNTFIFGHNMKNMTMFGSLKRFLSDTTLCDSDPYVYIYSADKTSKYRIFAYFTIPRTDSLYDSFTDEKGYDKYVQRARSYSAYPGMTAAAQEIDFDTRPNLLTLSTCWSNTHTHNFVVIGALVAQQTRAASQ